ncbi:MAG: hypothetical protein Q7K43_00290, partial [Candidatus Woesearchaeota archaeon]|nr:hypothetical protein [Candidatus Woesearchaeota archaeon]
AVYQTGSIRALGLSDIDLIIVVKDQLVAPEKIQHAVQTYMAKFPYFYQHVPIIISESLVLKLNTCYPLWHFNKIKGKEYNLAGTFSSEIALVHLINETITGLFQPASNLTIGSPKTMKQRLLHTSTAGANKVKIRYFLGRLSTFKYYAMLCEHILGKPLAGAEDFQKKIDILRTQWFNIESEKRIARLSELSAVFIELTVDLLDKVNEHITTKNLIAVSGMNNAKLLVLPRINYYSDDWNREKCVDVMKLIYKTTGELVNYYPTSMLAQALLVPATKYFLDPKSRQKLARATVHHANKNVFQQIHAAQEAINVFVLENHLPGKLFTKIYVKGFWDKQRRLIASNLFRQHYG